MNSLRGAHSSLFSQHVITALAHVTAGTGCSRTILLYAALLCTTLPCAALLLSTWSTVGGRGSGLSCCITDHFYLC